MHSSHPIYRALVTYSSSTTGEIRVKIPALLGADSEVAISYIGRKSPWIVPTVGDQIVVTSDDTNLTNVFWLQTDTVQRTVDYASGAGTAASATYAISATTSASSTYTNAENIKATPSTYGTVLGNTTIFLQGGYLTPASGYSVVYTDNGVTGTATFSAPLTTIFTDVPANGWLAGRSFYIGGPGYPNFYFGGNITSSTSNSVSSNYAYSSGSGSAYSGTFTGGTGYLGDSGTGLITLGHDSFKSSNYNGPNGQYSGKDIAIGFEALAGKTDPQSNIAIGHQAMGRYVGQANRADLYQNIAIGTYAGRDFEAGSGYKIAIGYSGSGMVAGETVIGANNVVGISIRNQRFKLNGTQAQVSFRAFVSSNVSYANTTEVVPVPFNGASGLNVGSCYSFSTYRFTAPVDGRYWFNASVWANSGNIPTHMWLLVNGSRSLTMGYNDDDVIVTGGTYITLFANDYVSIGCSMGGTSGMGTLTGSTINNYFTGYLVH